MRVPRIYHPEALQLGEVVHLTEDASNHVGRVLRLKEGAQLELFCGDLHRYRAEITSASKKHVAAKVIDKEAVDTESPVKLHLAQGISRGDRMDFVLQKSVELGVHKITPIFTERCTVKLQGERLEKKVAQWQKIVVSACEQSGRNFVPTVCAPVPIQTWLENHSNLSKVVLDPLAQQTIAQLKKASEFGLLIGPEGGFSDSEIALCQQHGAAGVRLGPRILRTETAALAAITALQLTQGDL